MEIEFDTDIIEKRMMKNGTTLDDTKKKKKRKDDGKKPYGIDYDWIASLAKNSVSNDDSQITSKQDRIRKREAKKSRRGKRKGSESKQCGTPATRRTIKTPSVCEKEQRSSFCSSENLEISTARIRNLSQNFQKIREGIINYNSDHVVGGGTSTKHGKSNFLCSGGDTSGKKKRKKWSLDSIQPRPTDYSGIGVARNSIYLEFVDSSFFRKLEEEFKEHVVGFYGKQRTKAMNKQINGNMLWRRLVNEKQTTSSKNRKKIKLSHEERIQQALMNSSLM